MGLVKCPNCKNDSFDDYKCSYCGYILKEKDNPYDKNIYNDLKNEYIKNKNKPELIKYGQNKYNLSLQETKEIVDFVADELYEKENFKTFDEVNNNDKYKSRTYKFSIINYFLHNLVFVIFFILAILYFMNDCSIIPISLGIFLMCTILFINLIHTVHFADSEFVIEPGNISFSIVHQEHPDVAIEIKSYRDCISSIETIYFDIIKSVTVHLNYITIKGEFRKVWYDSRYNKKGESKKIVKKIRVPKYYRNINSMIKYLSYYVK